MKGTQYFSHDGNARNDEKIVALRMKLGWEGYGLYWAIIEKLRESTDYRLSVNFNLLAFDLRTDNEKIKSIVTGFGLFTIDDDVFYSRSLCDRMLVKDEASDRAREKANKRWAMRAQESGKEDATAMLQHSNGNASKVKKSKESKEEGDAPARTPSDDWPGLTDREAWTANYLMQLTAGKLQREYISEEAKRLIAKKPDATPTYMMSWAKNLLQNQQVIAPRPGVPSAPKSISTGIKNL